MLYDFRTRMTGVFINGTAQSDTFLGSFGHDTFYGFGDDDIAFGNDGIDWLDGGAGNDHLFGGGDWDVLIGGDGDDSLDGGADDDSLYGGTGRDNLLGGSGQDWMYGDEGNDWLEAGDGHDFVNGGDGDDFLMGGTGADVLEGDLHPSNFFNPTAGSGVDTASYVLSNAGVTIELGEVTEWLSLSLHGRTFWRAVTIGNGVGRGGDAAGDTLYAIENIDGSAFDDTMLGNVFDNRLLGLAGDDWLHGGGGNDTLQGGYGADILEGGDGDDVIYGGGILTRIARPPPAPGQPVLPGPRFIDVANLDPTVWSEADGNDTIDGSLGRDLIFGGSGADSIRGGAGDDQLFGGDGADLLNGGAGADIIEGDVRYNLYWNHELRGFGQNAFADFMSDALSTDTASYAGSDVGVTVSFTAQIEEIKFDYSFYNAQNQLLSATAYALYFTQVGSGVGGDAQGDQLYGVENVIGSVKDDVIIGSFLDNMFDGGDGDDSLVSGGGADTLVGGRGFDSMTAGVGVQTFAYAGIDDAPASITYKGGPLAPGTAVDHILEFTPDEDIIDLSAIDANAANGASTNDAFILVGHFSGVAGELSIAAAPLASGGYAFTLGGDVDGDGYADLLIQVDVVTGAKLSAVDFIL